MVGDGGHEGCGFVQVSDGQGRVEEGVEQVMRTRRQAGSSLQSKYLVADFNFNMSLTIACLDCIWTRLASNISTILLVFTSSCWYFVESVNYPSALMSPTKPHVHHGSTRNTI
jgi:hypothetical protein